MTILVEHIINLVVRGIYPVDTVLTLLERNLQNTRIGAKPSLVKNVYAILVYGKAEETKEKLMIDLHSLTWISDVSIAESSIPSSRARVVQVLSL